VARDDPLAGQRTAGCGQDSVLALTGSIVEVEHDPVARRAEPESARRVGEERGVGAAPALA